MEFVARIEKQDIVARSHLQRLVHRIIKTVVGLRDATDFMRHKGDAVTLLVMVNMLQCVVARVTVYNEVLYVRIVLLFHTSDSPFNERSSVIRYCSNGKFQRFRRARRRDVCVHLYVVI